MDNKKSPHKTLLALQVGDLQTGKTSLYLKFKLDQFPNDPYTSQLDFFTKNIIIISLQKGQEIVFCLWDYHFNQRFYELLTKFYKSCSVLMISYDITNRESFEKALIYYKDYDLKRENKQAALFLIGNKYDLEEQREVSYYEGKQLSESLGMIFMEVSAKEDYQVKELLEKLIQYALHFN